MSECAEIKIGKYIIESFKNYLDFKVVNLFFSNYNLSIKEKCLYDEDDPESGEYTKYEYKTTVKNAKDRLDALGYGISNFKCLFNEKMFEAIDYSMYLMKINRESDDEDKIIERIKKNVTFRKWTNAINEIVKYQKRYGDIAIHNNKFNIKNKTECVKVIYYALVNENNTTLYALKTDKISKGYIYRAILDNFEENQIISLDISNLIEWTYDDINEVKDLVENVEKNIVLVEGKTDEKILKYSLEKLYPHLCDLFYFVSFNDEKNQKRGGGVSIAISSFETFYYSKMKGNFIVIFDNDVAGYEGKNILLRKNKEWPNNFKILMYPDINFLRKYPTIMPNGKIVNDNINKRAASIELYLPDEMIKTNGEYLPIEWEARKNIKDENNKNIKIYQGVISEKGLINDRFDDFKSKKSKLKPKEWNRMMSLLESIIFAFNK